MVKVESSAESVAPSSIRHMARLAAAESTRTLRNCSLLPHAHEAEAETSLDKSAALFSADWFAAEGYALTHTSRLIDPNQPECIDWTLDTSFALPGREDLDSGAFQIDAQAEQSASVFGCARRSRCVTALSRYHSERGSRPCRHYDWTRRPQPSPVDRAPPFTRRSASNRTVGSGTTTRISRSSFASNPGKGQHRCRVYTHLQRMMLHKQTYARENAARPVDFIEDYRDALSARPGRSYTKHIKFPWTDAATEWNQKHGKKPGAGTRASG